MQSGSSLVIIKTGEKIDSPGQAQGSILLHLRCPSLMQEKRIRLERTHSSTGKPVVYCLRPHKTKALFFTKYTEKIMG